MNIRDSYIHGADGRGVVKSLFFVTAADVQSDANLVLNDLGVTLADAVGTTFYLTIPTLNLNTTGYAALILTESKTNNSNYYLTFVGSNNTNGAAALSVYTNVNMYFNPGEGPTGHKGTLHVNNISGDNIGITIGNTFVALGGTYTPATSITSSSDNNSVPGCKAVWDAILAGMKANDAMRFMGFLTGGADATHTVYTPAAERGDTYKVQTAGYINGEYYQVNDTFICTTDGTVAATSSTSAADMATIKGNWGVIEGNGDYLSYKGGTMYGTLSWDGTTALPTVTTASSILVVDSNTTKQISLADLRNIIDLKVYVASAASGTNGKKQITAAQTDPYYNIIYGDTIIRSIQFKHGDNISISSTTAGVITFTATNTWRSIYVGGSLKATTATNTKAMNFASSNLTINYLAAGTSTGLSGNADYFTIGIEAKNWTGATSSAAGTTGYMPGAASADRFKYLRGDGSWIALAPSISAGTTDTKKIKITVGGENSSEFTIPYATNADTVDGYHADDFLTIGVRNLASINECTERNSGNEYLQLCDPHLIYLIYGVGWYTVSFDIRTDVAGNGNLYSDPGVNPRFRFSSINFNTSTSWEHKVFRINVSDAGSDRTWSAISVYFGYGSGAIVHVKNFKLERSKTESTFSHPEEYFSVYNHTHPLSIATDSGNSQLTLAASTKYKLTAGGSTYIFTTPADTWREIYVNGTSQIGTGSDTKALNITASGNLSVGYIATGTGTGQSSDYSTISIDAVAWSGATSEEDGVAGYMPAPTIADRLKFLRGDGSWMALSQSDHTHSVKIHGQTKTIAASGGTAVDLGNYVYLAGDTMTGYLGHKSKYIIKPVADFRCYDGSHTGCITITLPASIDNTMVSMWIDVYNYNTNTSFSVHVGGYTYLNHTWPNPFALVYGANHRVRFAHNGTNFIIYIGETNTVWSYPQVTVRDVVLGYTPSWGNWIKDWTISFSTTISTAIATIDRYVAYTNNIINKDATISSSLTTIATIAGVDIKAKIKDIPQQAIDLFNNSKTLTVDTWTTIAAIDTLDAGTYAIQINSGTLYASGVFTACHGTDLIIDEIPLHVSDTDGTWRPYARISGANLLMTTNETTGVARTYTVKILKLI